LHDVKVGPAQLPETAQGNRAELSAAQATKR